MAINGFSGKIPFLHNTADVALFSKVGAVIALNYFTTLPAQAMLCLSDNNSRQCQQSNYAGSQISNTTENVAYQNSNNLDSGYRSATINRYPPEVYTTEAQFKQYVPAQQTENYSSNQQSSYSRQNYASKSYQPTTSSPSTSYISNSYSSSSNYQQPESNYSGNSYDNSVGYFESARSAAIRNDANSLLEYQGKMYGSKFAMYPEYWRLNNKINYLTPNEVIGFVRKYNNSVMAEKLVADYAEKKARSDDFYAVSQVANYIQNADRSEACAIGLGDIYSNNASRLKKQQAITLLSTKKQPELCHKFARKLAASNKITATERQQRLYRVIRTGKMTEIITLSQTLGTPLYYSDLQMVKNSPTSFFQRFANQPYSEKNQYLYLYALGLESQRSFRLAANQLESDIQRFGSSLMSLKTQRMAYRTIAVKRMNMNTDSGFSREAVSWFQKSLGEPFNFEEAEDYAQASIRFSQWNDVIMAINNMDSEHQQKTMWQYWLARAHQQTGNAYQANQLFNNVAQENSYYGFLAKDNIGKATNLTNISNIGGIGTPQVNSNDHARMLRDPSFSRAFSLRNINKKYAKREWNWAVFQAIKNKDVQLLLAAANYADQIGWYDRAMYAMEKANKDLGVMNASLSHPMLYKNSVVKHSQNAGIDPAWAYGIIRQESRFNISARSHVGAGGLMQIMPATGKYIARNLGERYSSSNVNSGETNIRYGTWYMSDILGKLGGQPVLATAGYNAGPSKARKWQPYYGSISADQYVETIAYPETRDYVKHVMENATIYGNRLGRGQNISQRMGIIYPY